MKALILSIKAGMGHHKTGMAIKKYFESQGSECVMLDTYEYIAPLLGEAVNGGYLLSTKLTPRAFGKGYEFALKMNKPEIGMFEKMFDKISLPKIRKYILEYSPDVIVSTHPFSAMILNNLISDKTLENCLTVGVITDFTIHPFWEKTNLDYYVTASELLDYQMKKKQIPQNKILPFGIPIEPKFSTKTDKAEARKQVGIKDMATVLVIMGSMGYGKIFSRLIELDGLQLDFQIVLVCGNNKRLYKTSNAHHWQHAVYVNGYVDNVDVLMDAADIIVTKPGGLTTSELLAKNLPAVIMSPIPGQEDRNAEFLLNNGLAVKVTKLTPIDEVVYQLLTNPWRLEALSQNAKRAAHPDAAKQLCDFIIQKYKDRRQ